MFRTNSLTPCGPLFANGHLDLRIVRSGALAKNATETVVVRPKVTDRFLALLVAIRAGDFRSRHFQNRSRPLRQRARPLQHDRSFDQASRPGCA